MNNVPEGSIIYLLYHKQFLAWVTPSKIRMQYRPNIDVPGTRKKLMISFPEDKMCKEFPAYLYDSRYVSKPTIIIENS